MRESAGVRCRSGSEGRTELLLNLENGAGDEIRTRDIDLGKVALYQLSYSRKLA
jgi:hypothetical protein